MASQKIAETVKFPSRLSGRNADASFNPAAQDFIQQSRHPVGGFSEGHHVRRTRQEKGEFTRLEQLAFALQLANMAERTSNAAIVSKKT